MDLCTAPPAPSSYSPPSAPIRFSGYKTAVPSVSCRSRFPSAHGLSHPQSLPKAAAVVLASLIAVKQDASWTATDFEAGQAKVARRFFGDKVEEEATAGMLIPPSPGSLNSRLLGEPIALVGQRGHNFNQPNPVEVSKLRKAAQPQRSQLRASNNAPLHIRPSNALKAMAK